MNVLFIGDIFGKTGVRAITKSVASLKNEFHIDLVIANGENASNGSGLCPEDYKILVDSGVDVITLGNHAFGQESILKIIDNKNLIRPLNFNNNFKYSNVGYGSKLFQVNNKVVRVTNLLGESVGNKNTINNPFHSMNQLLENEKIKPDIHIVDFHAEYTGEKNAFLNEFAGRVSAIIGTHTHVQTVDNRIYKGTAYITDVGMTGPHDGIIGAKPDHVLKKIKGDTNKFVIEEAQGHFQLNAVFIEFDDVTNKAKQIKNIYLVEKDKCCCDYCD